MKKIIQSLLLILSLGMHEASIASMKPCDIRVFSSAISARDAGKLSSLIETCTKSENYDQKAVTSDLTILLTGQAMVAHNVAILDTLVQAGADPKAIRSSMIEDSVRIARDDKDDEMADWMLKYSLIDEIGRDDIVEPIIFSPQDFQKIRGISDSIASIVTNPEGKELYLKIKRD